MNRLKEKIHICLELYITAVKVGALTFGGGYAMLPILQREVVTRKRFATDRDILDYYALAQCLPGIIMSNTLAFVGNQKGGKAGAVAACLGSLTVPLILISIIAGLLTRFSDIPMVQHAFSGIRVCVCVLILNAVTRLWNSSVTDLFSLILFLSVLVVSLFVDITPFIIVIICGIAGLLIYNIGQRSGRRSRKERQP